jgi:dolichyl-phosphate beta-glucosyltransferase
MDLSLVIPAYNEEAKIARDVEAAAAFLVDARLEGEVIVVDDGSADDTAGAARQVAVPRGVRCRVIRCQPNRGKGHAVRTGMLETSGQFAMFADSGLCVPYVQALRGLELLRTGACDVAHGSRKLPETLIRKPQNVYRRLCSRAFRAFVFAFMGVPRHLTDTQCGFKMYRGDVARELYGECTTDGFMFDIEVLLRAVRKGYIIAEFPVEWTNDRDSRLHPLRVAARVLRELWAIKRALARE